MNSRKSVCGLRWEWSWSKFGWLLPIERLSSARISYIFLFPKHLALNKRGPERIDCRGWGWPSLLLRYSESYPSTYIVEKCSCLVPIWLAFKAKWLRPLILYPFYLRIDRKGNENSNWPAELKVQQQGNTYRMEKILQLHRPTLGLKGDPWL